jgi:hypothetical protein
MWRVDNRISGPGMPEPPCDVWQVPVRGNETLRLQLAQQPGMYKKGK